MKKNGYVTTILLGIAGLCISMFTLVSISKDASKVDTKVYIMDKQEAKLDSIHIKQNKLNLNKTVVAEAKIDHIKKSENYISYDQLTYNLYPNYLLWIMIVSIGISMALSLLLYLRQTVLSLKDGMAQSSFRRLILLAIFASLIILATAQFSAHGRIFATASLIEYTGILFRSPVLVLALIALIMLIPNLFCLTGNFMLMDKLLNVRKTIEVKRLIEYHGMYTQFLVIAAILLVFGVLSASTLRMSVLDFLPKDLGYLFPKQFVITYALIFTFFLLIFYLPAEFVFRSKFSKVREEASKQELETINKIESKNSVFKMGFSMLAPILSGLILEAIQKL